MPVMKLGVLFLIGPDGTRLEHSGGCVHSIAGRRRPHPPRLVPTINTAEHVFMKIRRFKVDDLTGPIVTVGGSEAGHALRVLRLKTGAEVVLFDGLGQQVTGRVCSVAQHSFEVEITRRYGVDPAQGASLVIASATPKGNRGDWLVEKCAELGVRELWLLRTERGEVLPGESKIARWRRKGVEAAKQTGHAITMEIKPPRTIADAAAGAADMTILYADPVRSGHTLIEALQTLPTARTHRPKVLIFIGPEGGFTEDECAEIEHAGGQSVRLSDGILRIETAAVAAASIWGAWAAMSRAE